MEDMTRDSAFTPKESGKAEGNLETGPKMDAAAAILTEAQPLSWKPPADHDQNPLLMPVLTDEKKESGKAEGNLGTEPKIGGNAVNITKAQPLSWKPPADRDQNPLLMPVFTDAQKESVKAERNLGTPASITDAQPLSWKPPADRDQIPLRMPVFTDAQIESVKAERNLGTPAIITDAQPFSWKPPADNGQNTLLMPVFTDGKKESGKVEGNLETEAKMQGAAPIITEAQPLSWKPPADRDQNPLPMPVFTDGQKESGKAEGNLGTEPKMYGNAGIITDAQPLSWKPPASHDQNPMLMPVFTDGQLDGLPAGWTVERRPRTSLKYLGKTDQFYYEPGTRRQFRSKKAVLRHLQLIAGQQHEQPLPPRQESDGQTPLLLQYGDQAEGSNKKSGGHSKKKPGRKRKQASSSSTKFDFANPPEKVTWALTDAESDKWHPVVGETLVPDAVKGLWAETFEFVFHQRIKAPRL